jgi:hypothetical protein
MGVAVGFRAYFDSWQYLYFLGVGGGDAWGVLVHEATLEVILVLVGLVVVGVCEFGGSHLGGDLLQGVRHLLVDYLLQFLLAEAVVFLE